MVKTCPTGHGRGRLERVAPGPVPAKQRPALSGMGVGDQADASTIFFVSAAWGQIRMNT